MKDLQKRKRVMARSMQLGHCICSPKQPCPCDIFRRQDLCPCAGERANGAAGPLRLMSLIDSAGCASKIDAATLRRVLQGLPFVDDPRVLVGAPAGDDAGVYKLSDDLALVQTVDVFSPSVDDPYTFGQIAAANSLSDVYAMGGRPITALSIVGYPIHAAPEEAMREILRGGLDKMAEAGVAVLGGHSIHDQQLKAGFAVTGLVHPQRIMTNAGARPGDRLILTKPLGTGIVAFAGQIGRAPAGSLEAAARWMAQLNRDAAEIMLECGVHACTDVTGFGLVGHLAAMAAASRADVEIVWDDLPLLPGVLQCLAEGIASGGVERNRDAADGCLATDEQVQPAMLDLCFDPQTSGGLLMAVAESEAGDLLARLHAAGLTEAVIIGRFVARHSGRVTLRSDGRRPLAVQSAAKNLAGNETVGCAQGDITELPPQKLNEESNAMNCCEQGSGNHSNSEVAALQEKFQEFLHTAAAPGALDGKTKRAIAIALSVLSKCEPCVKSHIKKAREMGFSQAEIDEAAWLAIAFGGSPTMMFYRG